MDHRFENEMENLERQQMDNCVLSHSQTGPLLEGLRHQSTQNRGSTLINYRTALQSILNDDSSVDEKSKAIKVLDGQYRNSITVTYQDGSGTTINATPSVFFWRAN